ncbi:DUF3078 domain-containing protein [Flavobacterium sp. SM15]|uniref:DUF3078 domain-containing protein n=1 Tax=Flavobacterium sp. SM15 TaxID=2908005 RepID=UPI001EDC5B4C|nr:DUF3078 domain-containing protein [Flavobacterium sp. SM15]MCG2610913.1 DUF3078 domain-containing protein [Flavobacterium sp. SM15]
MNSLKTYLLGILSIVFFQKSFAQVVRTETPDSIKHWESKNIVGLDLTQVSFVNWNAGGENSISGILKGAFVRKYTKDRFVWHNELIARYGLNKQDGREARKTDDAIQINSTAGYKTDSISNWYYSAKFNFNTQFTNGYAYPNTEIAISKPFAPAYIFLGVGSEYISPDKSLIMYFSPLTQKTTLVLDQALANQGAFGVDKATYDTSGVLTSEGKKSRTEVGILVTSQYKKEIFKNINLDNRVSFYTDYLNNFGNIDLNWQMQLDMVVNQYVRASIATHLIYDDDIKSKENIDGVQVTKGPKVQLKQILGVGLSYTF